jgi:ribose 5-phosphate isomerase B
MSQQAPPYRIAIATDHAAVDERLKLVEHLSAAGHHVHDLGCEAGSPCDYPDQAALVAHEVAAGRADFGVLLCGTGIGVAMAACKVEGIRAATIGGEYAAEMTRRHNDANVACFGARIHSGYAMMRMLDIFLETPFDGGRHAPRVAKIDALDAQSTVPAGDAS